MNKIAIIAFGMAFSTLAMAENGANTTYPAVIFNQDLSQKLIKLLPKTAPVYKLGEITTLMAPAPALKSMRVIAVDSDRAGLETYNTENLPPYETQKQHAGGARLNVVTVEVGFGRAYAKYNGANLSSTDTAICQDWSGIWRPCQNGELVGGWMRTWNAAGRGAGQFESWSTSLNMPTNTYHANIKVH
ncbi:DUF4879 domain-containing protein [Chromobacterium vaccinii]|uniref:DUF4879 domain-containing protein n=1 Tax=Chromobacterium vaccinii TaxID=1108595 RepID=UPI00163F6756|nr:DUF4879 domain-containing protein [Chromobacterium vaccinii]